MSDPPGSPHLDEHGAARMVDVGAKPVVARRARAAARVEMSPRAAGAIAEGTLPKGDAAAVARVAGIMAAKRTPDLIALCHPLPIERVEVDIDVDRDAGVVTITAAVATRARTGVEMEALTAVAVAALNLYDLVKGVDASAHIADVRVVEKATGPAAEDG